MVSKPIVGVITSETSAFGGRQLLHSAGQRYVDTLMKFSNYIKESVYVHYSPSYKQSIGVEVLEDKGFDTSYGLFRYTRLLMRKNTKTLKLTFTSFQLWG